jgi:uncharacterized protein
MEKKQKNKKRLIAVSVVSIALIFSIISMIVTVFIYNGQFPRYDRHDMTINAGLIYEDLSDTYDRELVSFNSGKNMLQGYVYGQQNSLGLVVVAHGIGGGADSYLAQITYFVDQGWVVFAYDATGSFDSEGKSTKGFPQSLLDLDQALTYIKSQSEFDNLPILLFGHSWGGYAVANIFHYDHDIAGVVSLSAPNSAMEIIVEQGRTMMGGFIETQRPFLWLYQNILFGKAASYTSVDAINKVDVAVMIVHGKNDEMIAYDGSSIISNADLFTNPNVVMLSLDQEGQSGHNNLFKSKESIAYINEINVDYRALYDLHDQNIPYEIKQAFYAEIDRNLAQDLNLELMDEINDFFLDCISK